MYFDSRDQGYLQARHVDVDDKKVQDDYVLARKCWGKGGWLPDYALYLIVWNYRKRVGWPEEEARAKADKELAEKRVKELAAAGN